jgi:hypothetical protein
MRVVNINNTVPLHEVATMALEKELGRELRCSFGGLDNGLVGGKLFFKYPDAVGYNEVHVGSWFIKNDKIHSFYSKEVEDEGPMVA